MWWRHGQMGLSSHETGDPKISVIARTAWNGGEREEKKKSFTAILAAALHYPSLPCAPPPLL